MKHSWGSRHRNREQDGAIMGDAGTGAQLDANPASPSGYWKGKPDSGKDVLQASDKLVTTVKSGVQSVLDMLSEMEGSISKQKALRQQERHVEVHETPIVPPVAPVPVMRANDSGSIRSMPPTYAQGSSAPSVNDPAISHILTAIEKMNARLDALSPPKPKDDTPPSRLV